MNNTVCQDGEQSQDQESCNSQDWTSGLDSLLQDSRGTKAFETFLEEQGCSVHLEFLWACEGMKNLVGKDRTLIPQIVNCIYRHYIKSGSLRTSNTEKTLRSLKETMKRNNSCVDIFNEVEVEVEILLRNEMYPKFLHSDIFFKAVQKYSLAEAPTVFGQKSSRIIPSDANVRPITEIQRNSWINSEHQTDIFPSKIILVINNDDLPPHSTLFSKCQLGNAQPKETIIHPESFVKELMEKLELLKFKQDTEGENLKCDDVRKVEQKVRKQNQFSTKLSKALGDHYQYKSLRSAEFHDGILTTDETDEGHSLQCETNSSFPRRNSRIKNYFHNSIFRRTKTQANIKKSTSFSTKMNGKQYNEVSPTKKSEQEMKKSLSLDLMDSGLDLTKHSDSLSSQGGACERINASANGLLYNSPRPFQWIQNWVNGCTPFPFTESDEAKLTN